MPDVTVEDGTMIQFNVTASYSPADAATDWTVGSPTNVAMTCSALADTAARQSAKFDFGANRAKEYAVYSAEDFTGETPTDGEHLDYYFAPSSSGTLGTGNVAGNSGADAACPDGALGTITLAEFLDQCQFIGSLIVHDGAVVQNGYIGRFSPVSRRGQLIKVNESGDALEADDVENCVSMMALRDDVASS